MQHLRMPSLGMAASVHVTSRRTSSECGVSSNKVRAVVTVGGSFKRAGAAGSWEYVGGAQKVVVLPRAAAYDELLWLLSSRAEPSGFGASQVKVWP
jgi:hypothetical protein